MCDLIHISVIEKYLKKIMKMDKYKVRETLEYIQRINKVCPNCKDNISKLKHSCKCIEDAYYSDKYDLIFCGCDCAECNNQEKCVICKDNLTAVNCELCNISLCEKCYKTDDKYSWYCEDCYNIKKDNEKSDNNTEDDDNDNDNNDDNDDDDDDDDDEDYLPCELCDEKSYLL
jgi:hypothetical protein